jgi:hypothetical protein
MCKMPLKRRRTAGSKKVATTLPALPALVVFLSLFTYFCFAAGRDNNPTDRILGDCQASAGAAGGGGSSSKGAWR